MTVERGLDPRDLTLLAFGGSGPVHACDLARTLGISRVVFPPSPGVFTAMGMLAGAVEHHELRPLAGPLDQLQPVDGRIAEMRRAAIAALVAQGYAPEAITFSTEIDLRLVGQDVALSIPFADFDAKNLRTAFITAYRDTYGYAPSDTVEASALRLHAHARPSAPLDFRALRPAPLKSRIANPSRPVFFSRDSAIATPVFLREAVTSELAGPLIIEGADTTIVVPPGALIFPNATGCLIATLEPAP